jgi:hypothetical protein
MRVAPDLSASRGGRFTTWLVNMGIAPSLCSVDNTHIAARFQGEVHQRDMIHDDAHHGVGTC